MSGNPGTLAAAARAGNVPAAQAALAPAAAPAAAAAAAAAAPGTYRQSLGATALAAAAAARRAASATASAASRAASAASSAASATASAASSAASAAARRASVTGAATAAAAGEAVNCSASPMTCAEPEAQTPIPPSPRYESSIFIIDESVKLIDDSDTNLVSFTNKYLDSNITRQEDEKIRKAFGMVFHSSANFDPKNPKPPCGSLQKDLILKGLNRRIQTLAEDVMSERARLKVDRSEPNVYIDGLIRRQNMFVEVVNALQHNKCAQYMGVRMYENGDLVLKSREFGDMFTQFAALVLNNLDKQPAVQNFLTTGAGDQVNMPGLAASYSVDELLKMIQDKKVSFVDSEGIVTLLEELEDVLKLINSQSGGGGDIHSQYEEVKKLCETYKNYTMELILLLIDKGHIPIKVTELPELSEENVDEILEYVIGRLEGSEPFTENICSTLKSEYTRIKEIRRKFSRIRRRTANPNRIKCSRVLDDMIEMFET